MAHRCIVADTSTVEHVSTWRPKRCRRCGRHVDDGATISKQGYCVSCGLARVAESITSMRDRSGAEYERFVHARHPDGIEARRLGVGGTDGRTIDPASTSTETDLPECH